jgi:hypothetical protein
MKRVLGAMRRCAHCGTPTSRDNENAHYRVFNLFQERNNQKRHYIDYLD